MCRLPGRPNGLFCCVRPDTRGSLRLRPRTPASRKRTSTKHPATAGSHPSVAAVPVSFPVSESTSLPASSRMGSRRCGPGRPRSTRSVWYAAGHLEPALRPARRAASPRPPGSGPAVGFARRGREVPHVRGHYHVRPAPHRRGQDVPVLRVVGHARDQGLVPRDHGIREGPLHGPHLAPHALLGQVGVVLQNVAGHLVQDLPAPPHLVDLRLRQPQEGVSEVGG